jgi:hypothetical protein
MWKIKSLEANVSSLVKRFDLILSTQDKLISAIDKNMVFLKKNKSSIDKIWTDHFDRVNEMFRPMSERLSLNSQHDDISAQCDNTQIINAVSLNSQHDISAQCDNTQIINDVTEEDY